MSHKGKHTIHGWYRLRYLLSDVRFLSSTAVSWDLKLFPQQQPQMDLFLWKTWIKLPTFRCFVQIPDVRSIFRLYFWWLLFANQKNIRIPKRTKMPQSSDFWPRTYIWCPWKIGRIPKWKDRIPTIYFQGRVVSFREFFFGVLTSLLVALTMGEGVYLLCKLH